MRPKIPKTVDGIVHWKCASCGEWVPASDYYSDRRTPNGLKAQCKRCHSATTMLTRDKENHRLKRREWNQKKFAADPEYFRSQWRARPRRKGPKQDARQIVHLAIRIGALVRPQTCEMCGERKRLTAHHDDYLKPLDVRWLCYLCHAQEHRMP